MQLATKSVTTKIIAGSMDVSFSLCKAEFSCHKGFTVFTEMRQAESRWNREASLALGRALLASESGTMTAAELALATGKHSSNVKRLADDLVEEGLLQHRDPPDREGSPGRRPTAAFALADEEQAALEASLRNRGEVGRLSQGQQLIVIDAGGEDTDLLGLLSEVEMLARATWAARCDGSREELLVAFDGAGAIDASLDLMAILSAAGLEATRATVSKVESGAELVRGARRRRDLAKRQARRGEKA
jgi:hypothetical protein